MTTKQLIENIKAMADKDGVVSLKKDSRERYYLQKIVGKNDGLLMNEWIKQNLGLVMYVKGKNDSEVILHRLRKNNILRTTKTKNGVKETLYASDLIVSNDDESALGVVKTHLRRQIKEQANARHMSSEEYVIQHLGIDYIYKNKVLLRGFDDEDRWIEKNIIENNADSLRRVESFVNVREWLKNNWKIQNKGIVSAFADYIISKYPEYTISARMVVKNKAELFKEMLEMMYPDKVVDGLKQRNVKLYNLIYSYRREVPNGHTMSMKQMIEDYIGKGELTYITDVNVRLSKYSADMIRKQLQDLFGKGDINNPKVVKSYENGVVVREKRKLLQAVRAFCKGNEITMQDFLKGEGYVQFSHINKKAKPAKRHKNSVKSKNNHNKSSMKICFGASLDRETNENISYKR